MRYVRGTAWPISKSLPYMHGRPEHNYNSVDPTAAATYHVLLYVDQLIELFLALDRVGVVGVKIVDGVFALDAYVLGQLVGTGYAQLQTLGYFVCQLVEHVHGPVGCGQAQTTHFRQLHNIAGSPPPPSSSLWSSSPPPVVTLTAVCGGGGRSPPETEEARRSLWPVIVDCTVRVYTQSFRRRCLSNSSSSNGNSKNNSNTEIRAETRRDCLRDGRTNGRATELITATPVCWYRRRRPKVGPRSPFAGRPPRHSPVTRVFFFHGLVLSPPDDRFFETHRPRFYATPP